MARAQLTAEIITVARAHVAAGGAAALSLRAVARELGMVSSAVYRYFPSRDDLLTALIVQSYEAIGEAAEAADAGADRALGARARWVRAGHAIRAWALAHPHEYALLYGSPVPGYRAPQETIPAAARVVGVLAAIARDAAAAGTLAEPALDAGALPPGFAADTARLRAGFVPGVDDATAARCLLAWTAVFGLVSFELFGHYENVVTTDRAAAFEHQLTTLAAVIGLTDG